jgi:hypothetical protein
VWAIICVKNHKTFVADILLWRPRFDSRTVAVGFMMDRVALGQIYLRLLRSFLLIFRQCFILIFLVSVTDVKFALTETPHKTLKRTYTIDRYLSYVLK